MANFKFNKFLRFLLITYSLIFTQISVAQNFRILVTIDDGIGSPLLVSLAQALNQLPNIEVVVSAPSENQSGSSHSSVGGPLTVKESKIEGIKESYSVSGRPADAVRFALAYLGNDRSFDLVVSSGVLHHSKNPIEKSIKEHARVIKKGGLYQTEEPKGPFHILL